MKNIAASKNSPRPLAKYDRLLTAIICVFLAAIVWLAFSHAVRCEFVSYDDGGYVYENPKVTAGLSLQGIGWAFTHFHAANWHPLTTISHMLDVQLYGLHPWGHHLTNILLHALAAILLFLALLKLTVGEAVGFPRDANSVPYNHRRYNFWASAFVAALFAIHPLRVESVAWVSERKDVLSGVFFMLTLLAYASYVRTSPEDPRRRRRYLLIVILFALGLMCKPTLVTLPFVLLLLDYWPLRRWQGAGSSGSQGVNFTAGGRESGSCRTNRPREAGGLVLVKTKERGDKSTGRSGKRQEQVPRVVLTSHLSAVAPAKEEQLNASTSLVRSLVIEKIPLFVLSAVSCIVTIFAQKQAMDTDLKLGLADRMGNAFVSYLAYIAQMFYPTHLAVLYPYDNIKVGELLFAIALLTVISALFILFRKCYPFLIVGWLWYLGVLVPMIGLVQVGLQPRADRYTYLPQIGLDILVTWGALTLLARWRGGYAVLATTATIVIALLIGCSRTQTSYWQTSETLWEHAIANTSNNYVAIYNLGTLLLRKRQPEAAIVQFQKSLQIKPDYDRAYVDIGNALMLLGQTRQAIDYYRKALEINPDIAEAWSNLGSALLDMGQVDESIQAHQKAVAIKPESADMRYNLGRAFAQKLDWTSAISCYEAGLERRPSDFKILNNLGVALAKTGRMDEAIKELREALRINPNYPQAHYNLAGVVAHLGQRNEAVAHYKEALRLRPDYAEARQQLLDLGELPPN